jgi:2-keto-3-deoxy-L-rhamnonate aldolase RhmA
MLDLEHSAMTIETAEELVCAVEAADDSVATVLRVPEGTDAWIKHALDTGAGGILVPMVNSAEEAADVAAAARYSPTGRRGVAGVRAAGFGDSFDEYVADANESTAVIVQIETRAGVAAAPEIAATDGITSLFVGPTDLPSSLADAGNDPPTDFEEVVASVRTTAHEHDCPAGIYSGDPDDRSAVVGGVRLRCRRDRPLLPPVRRRRTHGTVRGISVVDDPVHGPRTRGYSSTTLQSSLSRAYRVMRGHDHHRINSSSVVLSDPLLYITCVFACVYPPVLPTGVSVRLLYCRPLLLPFLSVAVHFAWPDVALYLRGLIRFLQILQVVPC